MNKILVVALFFTLLALVGCNKGYSDTSKSSDASSSDPTKDMTLTEAMNKLQQSGKLPVLDTSDTLTGIDADGDGIRDDIQAFIDKLDVSNEKKRLYREFAKAEQAEMLVDTTDKKAVKAVSENAMKWAGCLMADPDSKQQDIADKYSDQIMAYTGNTKIRFEQSNKVNAAYSGSVYRLLDDEACKLKN